MGNLFKKIVTSLRSNIKLETKVNHIESELIQLKLLCGSIHAQLNKKNDDVSINSHEFKVFSQFGDDGIIQYLISKIQIPNKTFIEFGVEDFFESNTRFLMMKDNWEGFVIDGSEENINRLKNSSFYWQYQLKAEASFITKENINTLLDKSGFDHDLGIMHIDLDGNDYWIWNEIDKFSPRILIIEYNSVLGIDHHWSVPYKADFQRFKEHYSGLYWGASLLSMYELGNIKGYDLVGSNLSGNNAYFVRKDVNTIPKLSADEAYKISKYRESRDEAGVLNFVSKNERLKVIEGMPVFDTLNNKLETIKART